MVKKTHLYNIPIFQGLCIPPLRYFFMFLCILPSIVSAQSFSEGESLFLSNQPELAIPLLEKSIIDGSAEFTVYSHLGIAYMQTGNVQKAIETFLKGTMISGTDKKMLYYNAGNAAFVLQDYINANEYFSLALTADTRYAKAYLNRGNTNVKRKEYTKAMNDYNQYLLLEPNSDQVDAIRRMVTNLTAEIEFQMLEEERLSLEQERIRQEETRVQAEQALMRQEQERIATEKAVAEAERRRKILEEVSESLQSAESTNLTAGTEGVLDYEYEEAELE